MNAIELLRLAILANNRDKDTFEQYAFWIRKLYGFMRKPVSEWQGEDVERAIVSSAGNSCFHRAGLRRMANAGISRLKRCRTH